MTTRHSCPECRNLRADVHALYTALIGYDSTGDIERAVMGALKQAIGDHGPITPENTSSAAKRVVGQLLSQRKQLPDMMKARLPTWLWAQGAICMDGCQQRRGQVCGCTPKCAVCGNGPHMAVHGPRDKDEPVGGEPWGHRYQAVPMLNTPDRIDYPDPERR